MGVTATDVKKLREKTGLGMMQCKRALVEADGDADKAMEILRKQGLETAAKKAGRATGEGRIAHYVHMNQRIGVLVEMRCETDFVASSQDFQDLLHDICMQVAATSPMVVSRDDISEDVPGEGEGHLPLAVRRQARPHPREDRGGQAELLLREGLPAGAALHQGPGQDRSGSRQRDAGPTQGEHCRAPVRPPSRSATTRSDAWLAGGDASS